MTKPSCTECGKKTLTHPPYHTGRVRVARNYEVLICRNCSARFKRKPGDKIAYWQPTKAHRRKTK